MSTAVASEAMDIPTATGPDPAVMEAIERGNAVVFFDVALGEAAGAPALGRIKLELFVKDVGESISGIVLWYDVDQNKTQLILSYFSICSAPRHARTFGRYDGPCGCLARTFSILLHVSNSMFIYSSVQGSFCETSSLADTRVPSFIVSSRCVTLISFASDFQLLRPPISLLLT